MECAVGPTVRVTIKAGDSAARLHRTTIVRLVELLLRKGSEQQPQPFDLLRIQNSVKQIIEIVDRDQFSLGNVAEVRARGQINCGRELRKEVFWKVEVEIEPGEVTLLLFQQFLDFEVWENHSPFRMVSVWQRLKPLREQVPVANLLR